MSYTNLLPRSHYPQMSMSVSMPLSAYGSSVYQAAPVHQHQQQMHQQWQHQQQQQQRQHQQQYALPLLPSDYHNRLRLQQNAMLVHAGPKDDELNDSDDNEEQEMSGRRPRRLAAVRAMASNLFEADRPTPPIPVKQTSPQRKPPRYMHQTNHIYYLAYSRRQRQAAAQQAEMLIPITIELDVPEGNGYKYRDTFLWNIREQLIPPEKFAEILCTDIDLPQQDYALRIATMIRMQIEEYLTNGGVFVPLNNIDTVKEDGRVVIELDIPMGNKRLRDRFEWDLYGGLSPEDFSKTLCTDLGLPPEFVPLIGGSMREQIARILRDHGFTLGATNNIGSSVGTGAVNSTPNASTGAVTIAKELRVTNLKEDGVWRTNGEASAWGPVVLDNSNGDYVTEEETRNDREARRHRRDNLKNDITQFKEAEAQSSMAYIKQMERRLEMNFNLANYLQYFHDPETGMTKTRYTLPKINGGNSNRLHDDPFDSNDLDASPDTRPRMMTIDGSSYDASHLSNSHNSYNGGDMNGSSGYQYGRSGNSSTFWPGSNTNMSSSSPSFMGGGGGNPLFMSSDEKGYGASTSTRGGWRGRNTDGKPRKLPDRCHNRYGKAMTLQELEAWHCDWCKLDGSRTRNLRRGPRGQKTLCNACGIRYCVDNKLPEARMDHYTDFYVT